MNTNYGQAKQLLGEVLKAKEFHPTAKLNPWWQRVLQWLANRLHIHIRVSGADWKAVAWWIGIIVGMLVITGLIVAIFRGFTRRQTTVRTIKPSTKLREDELDVAERALSKGEYNVMLHCLTESCLRFAERRDWIRYLPFRTARQYQGQLQRVADQSFLDTYQCVVDTAEAVLFAGKQLSSDEARDVYGRVQVLQVQASKAVELE